MAEEAKIILFASHAHGGIRELWANVADGLEDVGFAVELMGIYPYEGLPEPEGARPWSYVIPYAPKGVIGKLRMVADVLLWLRRTKPELIISAMPAANVLLSYFVRLASPKTRLILTHHSPTHVYRKLLQLLDRWGGSSPNVASIVCVSQTVARSLDGMPRRYREKIKVIKNSLPPVLEDHITALLADRVSHNLPISVVASGRLEEVKNHAMLLRSLAMVPDLHLRIVGSGHLLARLQAQVLDLDIADRVEFLGNRPRGEALELMAASHIFVQMSHFEGHSLALIEAAKLGLPLVVSDSPGQLEAITHPNGERLGIVVKNGDDLSLAQELDRLKNDEKYRKYWAGRSKLLGELNSFETMIEGYREEAVRACRPEGLVVA